MSQRLKSGGTVAELTRPKAYRGVVPDLKHCFNQGRKARLTGRSFSTCQYANIEKVKAWEEGWRSVTR